MRLDIRTISALILAAGLTPLLAQGASTRYEVIPSASTIKWVGEKVGANHNGRVALKSGWLTKDGDRITGGEFVVDMSSIVNDDLKSASQNKKLVGHLMSEDFFNVKRYPESTFVVSKAQSKGDGTYQISGDITIRGITKPVEFAASLKTEGATLRGTAKLAFDRAKHDVKFNSGSFMTNLGDKLIYDNVPLEIELVAKAK